MRRRALRWGLVVAVAASPGAARAGDAPSGPRFQDAPSGPSTFVLAARCRTLDPARISGPDDERLVLCFLEGLTALSPTGEVVPAAASSWTTSPDGRTWTFTLREATWQRWQKEGSGGKAVSAGPVKASDFVFAWRRLLDIDVASPHSHLLDGLKGVAALSTDKPRAAALDRVASDLVEAIGGLGTKKTLTFDQVQEFLDDTDRNARAWLSAVDAKEAKELLTWVEEKPDKPYQGKKAADLAKVLRDERARLQARVDDAEAHVGVDRGFYARDDRTLVVEVAGPSPWLPSLLARGPLVAVNEKDVTAAYELAFRRPERQYGNGPFLASAIFPPKELGAGGDPFPFQVDLVRNASHPAGGKAPSERMTVLVDFGPGEVLRRYRSGACSWIHEHALRGPGVDRIKPIRASRAPGWKPEKPELASLTEFGPDVYESETGSVYVLRFRCGPPYDAKETRQAMASLVARAALVAKATSAAPPVPTERFVHPRTTGVQGLPRRPLFDASKAAATYGKRKFPEGKWFDLVASTDDDLVADALAKAWKPLGEEVAVSIKIGDDLQAAIDAGRWHGALTAWQPDYDDPLAFLSAFTSSNPASDVLWSHAGYDALVAGAYDVAGFKASPPEPAASIPAVKAALARATDAAGLESLRRTMLAEAEAILLEEAVVVPLWVPVETGIVKKGVRGLSLSGPRRPLLDVSVPAFAGGP